MISGKIRFSVLKKLVLDHSLSVTRVFSVCSRLSSSHAQCDLSAGILSEEFSPTPWKLCAAVCLARLPMLELEKTNFEKAYAELLDKLELEKSVLSDWEVEKLRQDFIRGEIETGRQPPQIMDFSETLQDIEDKNETSLEEFRSSSHENVLKCDDSDMRNVLRRPKETLVLVTKQVLGNDDVWMLPVTGWRAGETLRESAERALSSHCGEETAARFISNAPSGFYKFKFPKGARRNSSVGAKLFIYNAFVPRADYSQATPTCTVIANRDKVLDYAWLAKDEMHRFLKPKYLSAVQQIML